MQYRKYRIVFTIFLMFISLLTGCGRNIADESLSSSRTEIGSETVKEGTNSVKESGTKIIVNTEISTIAAEDNIEMSYTVDTKVWDVIDDSAFEGYGRLIFPADMTIDKNINLSGVDSILT